jgi:hypothetical protein
LLITRRTTSMSCRVYVIQRSIENIAVSIERLRIPRPRHNRIRAQEPPDNGIIKPCVEVVDPAQRRLLLHSVEASIRRQAARV